MPAAPTLSTAPGDVVGFWQEAGPERWFAKDEAFDAEFKRRYEAAHEAAADGLLQDWTALPEGVLAVLILLDQFPRNAYRGSARMFATDARAHAIADAAVKAGIDHQVEPELRAFFYMPFMHAESAEDQARSVALSATLDDNTQRFARLHQHIIERFGRFPHRNALLGRASTEAERQFLAEGGFAG